MVESIKNIIGVLKETPIPTILVIAGIAFLLLSIVEKLAGLVVPPQRQLGAALLGGGLLLIGLALYIIPLLPPERQGRAVLIAGGLLAIMGALYIVPGLIPTPSPSNQQGTGTQESLRPGIQTQYPSVTANIKRFEKTGELVTLELTVQNNSDEKFLICAHSRLAELIDQTTGQSWRALNSGGGVGDCGWLDANGSSGAWMQFKISNPDEKTFSLSSRLFNTLVGNLELGKRQ
jgi:hypothetical protein